MMDGTLAKEIANGEIVEAWPLVDAFEDEIGQQGLQEKYIEELAEIVLQPVPFGTWNKGDVWLMLRATPEQRAQAFLKVIET